MSHTAEIIAVGTELLLGNIVNTNARDISQALSAVGVNVFWHTVVGDNPQRLKDALDVARKRADIIITTGGLGPTYDDLTKQTICEAFGKPLVLHQDILDDLKVFFEKNVHMKMPSNNLQQAELPEGCTVFDNPVGTAAGCAFEADGVHVLMLPGPPFEMLTMLKGHVVPYLRNLSSEVIVSHDIMTFGLGESPMEELMREKMSRMENPSLATAESCTGGRVAERMTALPGVSAVYRGGVVSYWTSVKADVLGVPKETLDAHGAVSEETARAMAEGARRITGADIAVSVTGVAGPDPDERGVPVGIVFIGLATPDGIFCRPLDLGKRRRDRIQDLSSNHALDVVRRYLAGLPVTLS